MSIPGAKAKYRELKWNDVKGVDTTIFNLLVPEKNEHSHFDALLPHFKNSVGQTPIVMVRAYFSVHSFMITSIHADN